MIISILGVCLSMLVIWRACDGFEAASNYLGRNLSDGVRGATINAVGSSVPELLTASIALLWYTDTAGFAFGIGTTAGSAIFNAAVIPSLVILTVVLSGMAAYVQVSRKVVLRDGIALILAEVLFIVLLSTGTLGPVQGAILVGFYLMYMAIMFMSMDASTPEEYDDDTPEDCTIPARLAALVSLDLRQALLNDSKLNFMNSSVLLGSAIVVIGGACWLLVECCYAIGQGMGIASYFVAVILAAAATSVPDTVLSIKDARAGNYDDAVANALGSNIFDICMVLGISVLLYWLKTGQSITIDVSSSGSIAELRVLLLIITVLIFGLFMFGKLTVFIAANMFALYMAFVAFIVARAYNYPGVEKISLWLQKIVAILN